MNSLETISNDLAEVVARADASVVSVQGRRNCGLSGVAWSETLVVTSARATERDEKLEVIAAGQRLRAELVGTHAPADLALLRVDAQLTPFAHAEPAALRLGEFVLALGRPGERLRARLGILSVLGAEWKLEGGGKVERYIESDLALPAGFAGGPLLRASGELIGVNSAGLARGALVTLPASSLGRFVEALVAHGRVRRAHLGVAVHAVRLPSVFAEKRGAGSGVIVLSVQPDSPAERAGILLGDVLLAAGESALTRVEELQNALGESAIGQTLELELLRAGEQRSVRVTLEEKR